MDEQTRINRQHREMAADYCAANPGRSVIVGRIYRDAAGHMHTKHDRDRKRELAEAAARADAIIATVGLFGLFLFALVQIAEKVAS